MVIFGFTHLDLFGNTLTAVCVGVLEVGRGVGVGERKRGRRCVCVRACVIFFPSFFPFPLTFYFGCTAYCKALFSSKRTVQGRQSIQLGKRTFSNLTSYKIMKAKLFVHIRLERIEWISCNDVSCIM